MIDGLEPMIEKSVFFDLDLDIELHQDPNKGYDAFREHSFKYIDQLVFLHLEHVASL